MVSVYSDIFKEEIKDDYKDQFTLQSQESTYRL